MLIVKLWHPRPEGQIYQCGGMKGAGICWDQLGLLLCPGRGVLPAVQQIYGAVTALAINFILQIFNRPSRECKSRSHFAHLRLVLGLRWRKVLPSLCTHLLSCWDLPWRLSK